MGPPNIQIPITTLLVKEIDFKGSFRYGVSTAPLVAHRISWIHNRTPPFLSVPHPTSLATTNSQ